MTCVWSKDLVLRNKSLYVQSLPSNIQSTFEQLTHSHKHINNINSNNSSSPVSLSRSLSHSQTFNWPVRRHRSRPTPQTIPRPIAATNSRTRTMAIVTVQPPRRPTTEATNFRGGVVAVAAAAALPFDLSRCWAASRRRLAFDLDWALNVAGDGVGAEGTRDGPGAEPSSQNRARARGARKETHRHTHTQTTRTGFEGGGGWLVGLVVGWHKWTKNYKGT